jgi:UDP-N-acetylmuramate--alanine ligase
MTPQADIRAEKVLHEGFQSTFSVHDKVRRLGRLTIQMPGLHNVYNALAAIACGLELEIPFADIQHGLESFRGIQRRFQVKGEARGITVIDDYAHHPVEIAATLETAQSCFDRRVVAVFQPHRYSRTRDQFNQFLTCFNQADLLVLTDIYPASEQPIEGITGRALYQEVLRHGHRNAQFCADQEEILEYLGKELRGGDMVAVLGAGPINQICDKLLDQLREG